MSTVAQGRSSWAEQELHSDIELSLYPPELSWPHKPSPTGHPCRKSRRHGTTSDPETCKKVTDTSTVRHCTDDDFRDTHDAIPTL
jgi:hypothetical protein